ncbi:MAG TPA: Gfo/Idh/MocA family oxidoreductase [bacterium]|nr:Gfo/Idh/MocA family oxidoreductase [bacterium]HQL64123.1 Gfo/Idh/MocA family oxidoreductase [bacterium]
MTKHIQIACVGGGYWGKNLVRNFYHAGVLSHICELAPEKRREMETAYPDCTVTDSLDSILEDGQIAGVAIATPAETHGDLVRRSLLAGKDVFVEKPLCLSVAEGKQLVALAAERQRILMVGHLLWYHPAILKLKELVDTGELGRIQYIYSNRLNLGKIRAEENILWSFAPHDISVILGLLGEMPETVEAKGGNYLNQRIADVTLSWLSFPSGTKAHVFVSWLHPFKEQKLVVVGERKMAVFDDVEEENKLLVYPHSIEWKNRLPVAKKAPSEAVPLDRVEPLRAECEHFIECIHTRRTPRTDGQEALRTLTVLDACQRCLAQTPPSSAPAPPLSKPPYFVHESSYLDDNVEIGEGTMIWHFSHVLKNCRIGKKCRIGQNVVIGPDVTIGDNVKIQNNVSVYKGVTLEDHVFCGPSMVFTNVYNPRSEIIRMDELRHTLVRRGASLGANCTVLCGITIGQYAFIGAGAVVIRDVPDYALVVGNPAKTIGWMCVCGNRIRFEKENQPGKCTVCERTYRKDGEQVRLQS